MKTGIHNDTILVVVDRRKFLVEFEAWKEPRLGWSILLVTNRYGDVVYPDKEEEKAIDVAIQERLEKLEKGEE
ncbi:hypothetical protein KAR91_38155 [Candidatus Pacearchaeota archaeon]|nr:hypothetical protein [Candidatus Pacearchaeota archaeon]